MTRKQKVLIGIEIALAAVFIFSSVNVGVVFANYQAADELYTEVQDRFVMSAETQNNEKNDPERISEPPPINIDFDGLLKENKDVVGWIYSENTVINYPVVQASDNKKYLRRGLDGKNLISGTTFADSRNRTVGIDKNYIIYGHNMNNKTMFGTLPKYKKQSYYDEHPVLYYLTPTENYRIELFAGLVVNSKDMIYQTTPSNEEFDKYLEGLVKKSTFKSNVEVTSQDKIITLSTCSYEFNNARYIVIGKLVLM